MADTEQKLSEYKGEAIKQLEAAGVSSIDFARLDPLVESMKNMIENRDALYVAGSDASERETVRRNFVAKKLGVDDREKGERAVEEAAKRMAASRMKNRAAFYYLVQEVLG